MTIIYTAVFLKHIKALAKKYPSIGEDLEAFGESLLDDPQQGESLGKSWYKVRFAISSKKTGKRNDSRIITFVKIEHDTIHLVAAFEKGRRYISDALFFYLNPYKKEKFV